MVGANGIDALVCVGEVDALEMVAHPGQVAQTSVVDAPVGQHPEQGREDVERAASCIGIKECRYHDIGTILVYCSVFGIEGAAHACSCRILYASVAVFDSPLIYVQVVLELLEGPAIVAVSCRAGAGKG